MYRAKKGSVAQDLAKVTIIAVTLLLSYFAGRATAGPREITLSSWPSPCANGGILIIQEGTALSNCWSVTYEVLDAQ
jgi:hypothetical protein